MIHKCILYRSGASGMDNLNGYVLQYQQDGGEDLTIEIPEDQMSDFLVQFSQEVYDTKTIFGRKGWCITAVVTLFSASIAYFISGKALEPLKELAQQAEKVDQDNLVDVRLEENTVAEFRQLCCSTLWKMQSSTISRAVLCRLRSAGQTAKQ